MLLFTESYNSCIGLPTLVTVIPVGSRDYKIHHRDQLWNIPMRTSIGLNVVTETEQTETNTEPQTDVLSGDEKTIQRGN